MFILQRQRVMDLSVQLFQFLCVESTRRARLRARRAKKRLQIAKRSLENFRRQQVAKRRILMAISLLVAQLLTPIERLCWTVTRSDTWWKNIVLRTFTHQDWLENFRMSKETFLYICRRLSGVLIRQDTVMRRSISVQQRVAITLWCLATPAEYRTISHLFGVARSSVCEIVHETCNAIVDVLLKEYIKFPTGRDLDQTVNLFKSKWGVPQCFGAVDGCHVPISVPCENHTEYYNRKGWYSMLIQGLADANYCFLDICVGWPGSVHDARVFSHSNLYSKITRGQLLPDKPELISGISVPLFMIGDSAYPLQSWLLKPFQHNSDLTTQQRTFNYRISRARIVVENTFGRLKARWRRLMKRNDMFVHNIPQVIAAACVLHNICEQHNQHFNDAWLQAEDTHDQPATTMYRDTSSSNSSRSRQIRNALVSYFQTH
ncbi:uncharacterized protein [Dysidea avara]|uniref:uncharacterized protein n=1 Tax=Dysidea avara TaxID=196820 RepID=UPI0033316103